MRESLAYEMMFQFLEERYRLLPSDALGSLLSDLRLLDDNEPADPAMAEEWDSAVEAVRQQHDRLAIEPLRKAS
jgi:hypothetical protein